MILLITLLSDSQKALVKQAEEYLGFNASYFKEWAEPDPFRLSLVKRGLRGPLELDEVAEEVLAAVEPEPSPKAIPKLWGLLDVKVKGLKEARPKSWEEALGILGKEWAKAEEERQRAFAGLSEAQRDTLLYYSLAILGPDSADSLKGLILRERGIEADTGWCDDSLNLKGLLERVDWEALARGSVHFLRGLWAVLSYLEKEKPEPGRYKAGKFSVLVAGTGNDQHRDYPELLVDLGGNDSYLGRPAGSVEGLSAVIDLAGDDRYEPSAHIAAGASVMGYAALVDLGGKDVYRLRGAAGGAAFLGLGLLWDAAGDDILTGDFFALGAGFGGLGLYWDGAGHDTRRIAFSGEGFGGVKGLGLLVDREGNDLYYAGGAYTHDPLLPGNYQSFAQGFAIGWRPELSGGIGILIDAGGNDFYNSEVYSQGTGYWFSLGILVDSAGDDFYQATEYAQGAGIHLALGVLADLGGRDHYYSKFGPAQGEGHDLAVGLLYDRSGNDNYFVSGGMGVGLANGTGLLFDGGGDDAYSATEPYCLGAGKPARDAGSLGLFIDAGGKDRYPKGTPAKNGRLWVQEQWGLGWDR